MPEHITASGPSSLAAGSILSSLIVTGSGNAITVSAADFLRDARARHHLRMLAVIAELKARDVNALSPLAALNKLYELQQRVRE